MALSSNFFKLHRTLQLFTFFSSVFLEEFLEDGRTPDGKVPDIIFEQLPFDHPICINFTSGTTGLPKAPVHSAGVSSVINSSIVPF